MVHRGIKNVLHIEGIWEFDPSMVGILQPNLLELLLLLLLLWYNIKEESVGSTDKKLKAAGHLLHGYL